MVETNLRAEARQLSVSPNGLLAAPTEYSSENVRNRSASSAPSFRSTQSNVTIVDNTEETAGRSAERVRRQQTFKIRKISFMDRLKGLFDPKGFHEKIEREIEAVEPDVLDERMLDHTESPFIVDVHVSPKINSRNHHTTRCLLDTGCLQGNIVSKELVESLGFTDSDYEPLSHREKQGGQTMTGEMCAVDGALLLSWHHNSSPQRFRHMRFLVSSHTRVDMIIGTRSIIKHNLMAPPIFVTTEAKPGSRIYKTLHSDATWSNLMSHRATLLSEKEEWEDKLNGDEAKKDEKYRKQIQHKVDKKTHALHVQELRVDAHEAQLKKQPKEADRLRKEADEEEKAWNRDHPVKSTARQATSNSQGSTGSRSSRTRVNNASEPRPVQSS